MTPLKKVAIFLIMMGAEKGQSIIAQMDNGEIHALVPEIQSLTVLSQEVQESVLAEFRELGYEDNMKPSEALTVIRILLSRPQRISGKTNDIKPNQ